MSNITTYIARGACLSVGVALAGIGMYASYEAAAQSGSAYLMIAAPLVALAAPLVMVFVEIAIEARQYVKALALLAVFGLTAATVFYTAVERNHAGRAVGEAQHTAYRIAVDRANKELIEAKADAQAKTAAADKVRGQEGDKCKKACQNIKASEKAAAERLAAAKKALADADALAVTESDIKQPDWLMPASVDVTNMVLIWVGFGLGSIQRKPAQPAAPVEPKARKVRKPAKSKDPKRVEAGKKAAATNKARKAEKAAAIAAGKVAVIK
jgi:hypothetical protein